MRASTPFCRLFFWAVALLCLLQGATLAFAQSTIIRGTVTAPYDATYNPDPDPMPNIVVFVAPPGVTLPDFTQPGFAGITGNSATSCAEQQSLLLGDPRLVPVAITTTDYTGAFTLTGPALTALPEDDYTLVIQAGKWRHRQTIHLKPGLQTTLTSPIHLPSAVSATDDLPKIAVVTGQADTIECIFQQMGISNSEVTDPSGSGHIHLYPSSQTTSAGSRGSVTSGTAPTKTESDLMSSFSTMQQYDMVMFGCTGTPIDPAKNLAADQQNLAAYANQGGRVFATHYEFIWLNKPNTFLSAANWDNELDPKYSSITPTSTGTGTIQLELDPTKTNSEITELAQWLKYRGYSTTYGQIPNVQNVRQDQTGILGSTQEWGYLLPPYNSRAQGTPIMQFTFDTPLNAGSGAGATVATTFNHSPTNFLLGDTSDTITLNVSDTATVDAPALTVTISLPGGLTATSISDASGNPTACDLSSLTCSISLAAGASDLITLKVAVPSTSHAGQVSVTATVSGASLSITSAACGRVMYNEYHVESGNLYGPHSTYPLECGSSGLSGSKGVEKFLEFSLYNLSNFIPSGNSDSILIQGYANLAWQPKATLYYTEPLSDAENATADVAGSYSYTFSPAYTGNTPDAGTYNVTATFTPTDAADYIGGTLTKQITVLPDPTQSLVTSLVTPISYGQEIGYTNGIDAQLQTLVAAPGYTPGNSAIGGNEVATIDGKTVCTVPAGQATRCPDPPFLGWDVGTHSVALSYAGATDYGASVSPAYPVVINPDPTATSITSTSSSVAFGTGVTVTAAVADQYTPAVGQVTFYDNLTATPAVSETQQNINPVLAGLNPIGTAAVTAASSTVPLTLTNLLPGTHYISACFVTPVNASGTYNFLNSCSASTQVVVKFAAAGPLATVSLVKSSANPSVVGQAVSFTAIVETTGTFTQTPSGTVTFYDGTTSLGTSSLAADGTAVFTTTSLTAGTHSITVKYSGSATLAASTSSVLTQLVGTQLAAAPNGFLLLVDENTVPVYVGSSAVVNVQIVPLTDFNQPVQLSCTGLPSESACTFAQTTVPAGGGKTQLLVSSSAPHDCSNSTPYFASLGGRGLLSLAGLCGLTLCFARRRRVLQGIALAGLLCLMPGLLTGCGSNCTDFAVKPGDYSFTLTATPQGIITGKPSTYTGTQTQAMTMRVHL